MRFLSHGFFICIIVMKNLENCAKEVIVRGARFLNDFCAPSHRVAIESLHIMASLLSQVRHFRPWPF